MSLILSHNVSAQTQPSNAREQRSVAPLLSFWSRWLERFSFMLDFQFILGDEFSPEFSAPTNNLAVQKDNRR